MQNTAGFFIGLFLGPVDIHWRSRRQAGRSSIQARDAVHVEGVQRDPQMNVYRPWAVLKSELLEPVNRGVEAIYWDCENGMGSA